MLLDLASKLTYLPAKDGSVSPRQLATSQVFGRSEIGVHFMASWNTWGEEEPYCWVVICKNQKFHRQQNLYSGHKIPLGETDAFAPPPAIDFRLTVRCDECGEEHTYDPAELVRFQMNFGPGFKPHPLFT